MRTATIADDDALPRTASEASGALGLHVE